MEIILILADTGKTSRKSECVCPNFFHNDGDAVIVNGVLTEECRHYLWNELKSTYIQNI